MRSGDFMRAIPDAVRGKLPEELQGFKTSIRSWLVQLYYGREPRIHYEAWLLMSRYQRAGSRTIEIGLHFECKDADENTRLLELCYRNLFEIKAELGEQVEAEPWDRGWAKLYEVLPLSGFNAEFLDLASSRLALFIQVLQPIIDPTSATSTAKPTRRKRT
jgi:hypothetical protein